MKLIINFLLCSQLLRLEFENQTKCLNDEKILMEREIEKLQAIICNNDEGVQRIERCDLYENHKHELEEIKLNIEKSLRTEIE